MVICFTLDLEAKIGNKTNVGVRRTPSIIYNATTYYTSDLIQSSETLAIKVKFALQNLDV